MKYSPSFLKYILTAVALLSFNLTYAAPPPTPQSNVKPITNPRPLVNSYVTPAAPAGIDFKTLPACPAAGALNCPEISQKFNPTSISLATCPDVCTVTRNPEVVNSFTLGTIRQNPICPTGYTQVGSFNVQQEVNIQPAQSGMPITGGMAQFTSLALNAPQTGVSFPIGTGTPYQMNNPNIGQWSCPAPNVGDIFESSNYASWGALPPGYVYKVVSIEQDICGCAGSCWTCVCNAAGSHNRTTKIKFQQVFYTIPAGLVPTGRYLPVAVVCSHIKQQWYTP